jgi:phosphoenolpyruvate-protein phosphotransferase (PTS system enzyme I)
MPARPSKRSGCCSRAGSGRTEALTDETTDEEIGLAARNPGRSVHLQGIAASPGVAVGRAFTVDRRRIRTPKYHIPPEEVDAELERLDAAIRLSEEQLETIKSRLREEVEGQEHLLIIEAHRLMLRDEMLVDGARRLVRDEYINAEWAIRRTVKRIKRAFDSIDHEYFRERRGDVDFVGDRIIRNLMGQVVDVEETPPEDAIVVAHDLSPADTVLLSRHDILGIVTDVGAKTSHSAIVARALEIPAVVGTARASEITGRGDRIVVDGTRGVVVLWPTDHELTSFKAARRRYLDHEEELLAERDLPAVTSDGHRIGLYGNIEFDQEVDSVLAHGGEGIGLYRTEFLYVGKKNLPTEEEHYQAYRAILERMGDRPVTIRTFDLGGDKVPILGRTREPNPAMGLRAIRFSLQRPDIFATQVRALLRAGVHGNLRIMFPMIAGPLELRRVKDIVAEVEAGLTQAGVHHAKDVPMGIMVELPSAALLADKLAAECDFFSIGTNDLIQYTLGIDRQNREVAYLYRPLHLAVLRLVRQVVEAGQGGGIPVSICGEMAGEPLHAPLLVAMGFSSLSMNALSVPLVKRIIRAMSITECQSLLARVFEQTTVDEIEAVVRQEMEKRFPGELSG